MNKKNKEMCTCKAIREIWKVLNKAKNLEEAREQFKALTLRIILGE